MSTIIEQQTAIVIEQIKANPQLNQFVNSVLPTPKAFRGSGEIKLVILGQDPTVKNQKSLAKIKTVLNLDKSGNLRNYLSEICKGLGLDLNKNVYATNYLKNFFVKPPTQFKDNDLFTKFAELWLPLLRKELAPFGNIPVITLGQPVLSLVTQRGAPKHVRDYWGYNNEWKSGKTLPFKFIDPENNLLNHNIFPFPHQPSIAKQFYRSRLMKYVDFMRDYL